MSAPSRSSSAAEPRRDPASRGFAPHGSRPPATTATPAHRSALSAQVVTLARRAMLKTLRQPFQMFPVIFFPAMLLVVNASGLRAATHLPGFPNDSYITFAIAVAFIQGGMFSLINTGTNLAEDIESGFFHRLALTPMHRVSLLAGILLGVGALGAIQSTAYIAIGLVLGAHIAAGFGGALVLIALGALAATAFGAVGCFAALRTGSGEAVQGMFPLFFVFIFLSSSNLPRNLLRTGWFHTIATWNPISYLIEGFRSLYVVGWDATALWRGFAVATGLLVLGLALAVSAMRTRLQRT
ncbi:MAG TPA: ABC transporter permease [Solirubrobacteraceae bacterium]|nr:ABC transporter permease [Solirubrobacteraceae bacterium]